MTAPEPNGSSRELVPGVVVNSDGTMGRSDINSDDPHGSSAVVEVARFLGDVARLLWRVARDGRVPWPAKALAAGAVAYVVSPIDLIPDFIPGIGQMDDLFVLVRSVRYLVSAAGYEVLRDLWPGSDEGFAVLLALGGVPR